MTVPDLAALPEQCVGPVGEQELAGVFRRVKEPSQVLLGVPGVRVEALPRDRLLAALRTYGRLP